MAKRKPKNEHAYGYWVILSSGEECLFFEDENMAHKKAKEAVESGNYDADVCKVQTSYFKSQQIITENAE